MRIPLKVLLVEDSKEDAELLLYALKQAGYLPSHAVVQNASGMRMQLNRQKWDLVISDYVIPGFGGLPALKVLRDSEMDIPFIVVSGKIGEDEAVEALHAGANDYLLKDRLTRLGPAVERALKETNQRRKRKQAEDALRESEERFRRLVECCPDGMFIISEGKIVFANPAGVRLLNAASPVELVGKPILEFVDTCHREIAGEHLRQTFEGLDGPLLEQKMLRLDGSPTLVEAVARRIQYHGEAAIQLLCRDISSRKQMEQQLAHAQKMEAIARLAGGVANDFNNLLTVVMGYTGLIRSGLPSDHPSQKDIQQVLQSTERAIGLTGQLLALSRKEVLSAEPIEVDRLFEQLLPLLRRMLGDEVRVELEFEKNLPPVRADRSQLETVIINLAIQSRESMVHGGTLTLSAKNLLVDAPLRDPVRLAPGRYVVLGVSDTGEELSDEVRQHFFDPFFGGGQAGRNSGLSLTTVYAIVRQHGGQIRCASETGKGSRFEVYLPAQTTPAEVPAPRFKAPSNSNALGGVILLVEDEDVLREFANLILRKNGYQVLTARDGIEALKLAEQFGRPPDLLFTDVVMPRMGGAELSKRFAEMYAATPVLFTSGYPRSVLADSGLEESGLDFLQKPYTTQTLLDKIRSVMGVRQTG